MPTRSDKRFVLFAYALSGACSLVYQLVWYHFFVDHFGATGTTYLVVLCTFIGGLGLGAIASQHVTGRLSRIAHVRDLRTYGLIELLIAMLVIGLIGLTRIPLVQLVGSFPYVPEASGPLVLNVPNGLYQGLRIGLSLLVIGVPCFLMGTTYPYVCSLFTSEDRFPSQLYAVNTLGACLSIFLAEFVGFPALGYFSVMIIGLAVNLLIALGFLAGPETAGPADRRARRPDVGELSRADVAATEHTDSTSEPLSDYPAVLSGFLCGGLEALAFILIKLTYFSVKATFALLSFHAIAGIWLASTLVHRFKPRPAALVACAWAALAWCVGLWFVEPDLGCSFVTWWADHLPGWSPYWKGVIVTFVYTAFYISVPYACMSTLLPALCDQKQANGEYLSATYGLNTLAFLAGVLLFGWALQYVHPFYAARIFALMAFVGVLLLSLQKWAKPLTLRVVAVPIVLLGAGFALTPPTLAMRLINGERPDARPILFESTPQHVFWVKAAPDGRPLSLMFDSHSMSAVDGPAQRYMRMMAHFPLLLQPQPRKVLLICFGVGSTADAIRSHETVEHVDILDLNAPVYRLNRAFAGVNHHVLADPKLSLVVDDGRQFLKLSTNSYDLVTLEPPPPLKEGISRLYSREFYRDVRRRLTPGGYISQWLPEDYLDQRAVDLIVRTFIDSFPDAFCFVGAGRNLILVGCNGPISLDRIDARLSEEPRVQAALRNVGVEDAADLVGSIVDTPDTLRAKWSGGPLIRDGFICLDNILVSPVQYFGPRQEFSRHKPNLHVDKAAVRSWLAGQRKDLAREYDRFWKRLPERKGITIIMPACYSDR